jgi:molybdopterin molybdotransferase
MIDPTSALDLVLENTDLRPGVSLPLSEALGCILAEPVVTDRDYPPFDRAMMDGVAVHAGDAGTTVKVIGEVAAGTRFDRKIEPGTCVNIMTGAPCPENTDTVVKEEALQRSGDEVTLPEKIAVGKNIDRRGSERPAGAEVLDAGDEVTPLAAAVLATVGRTEVKVRAWPRIGLITTGREVVEPGAAPKPHQIRNSNGPMLAAMAARCMIERFHADDTEAALHESLERAGHCDVVLLTGGVSAGKYDLVPGQVEQYGAKILFHKVLQKPGKPLLFARNDKQLIFGLPGNPLAVHFCYHRYVQAAIRVMTGRPGRIAALEGVLAEAVGNKGKRHTFMLARAEEGKVTPCRRVGMADLFTTVKANAYLYLPPGKREWSAGEPVEFNWLEPAS